jgi:hypothetical protein
MKQNFTRILTVLLFLIFHHSQAMAQCTFSFTVTTQESRCTATGVINVTTSGGSGNFNYKVSGPIPATVTSSNIISGLPPGNYTVEVTDLVTNCVVTQTNVIVAGNYQDPRFQVQATDVTCINGTNGTLTAISVEYGRPAFTYQIVAPSTTGVGTTNTTGVFSNLPPGSYSVRLTDSCGGIQTRLAVINNYNWSITQSSVIKFGCDSADASLTVTDSKGNTNVANPSLFTGFTYGVSKAPGDTVWFTTRSFRFLLAHKRSVTLIVQDPCGNRKYAYWTDTAIPTVGANVTTSDLACTDFRATVTGQTNLTIPTYTLLNSSNVVIATNGGGVFNNIPYGSYCIRITDACYDTTITRCFTVNRPVPSVAANLSTSNITCSSFTATVTGQTNLSNPQYCIYNNANVLVSCNTTGVFTGLPLGSYCVRITNNAVCYDTVITRCVNVPRPTPNLAAAVTITNTVCSTFTATTGTGTNTTNPQYCIYTSAGVLIACNTTGIFDNLPYGSYCINMVNDPVCYDTTIIRCFTVNRPIPTVASTVTIARACSTFTATITGQANLTNPNYCIYNSSNVQVACNTTGVFTNLPYGDYCIRIVNNPACYDTTIVRCFTASRLKPSVSNTVKINNQTCTDFRAEIQGPSNLTSPTYCLFNSSNVQLACNTNGRFNNLPYGSYCIRITTPCYDTTISRCFTVNRPATNLDISSHPECDHGFAHVLMNFSSGIGPHTIQVYNPGGALVRTIPNASANNEIFDLPVLPGGLEYMFVGIDACGGRDTTFHALDGLVITKNITATSKCPGGSYPNGYGDLNVTCTNNADKITPKIIKKNDVLVSINHADVTGYTYRFTNLEPATYIVEYTIQSWCSNRYYDTFQLRPYVFPSLSQSAVYQCANNSFNVSAAASGGIPPFTYEILGSVPASPSIVRPAQTSPLFTINNGTDYSLINLRAVDACGNGSVNDVAVLPLANTIVSASSNCYYNNITLSVPVIPNVTYSWYKKTSPTDSILVGTSPTYQIPYLLPTDTGIYVSKVSLNNGCLTRLSTYTINGSCGGDPLSISGLDFSGSLQGENVQLRWKTQPQFDARTFVIERSHAGGPFIAIGTVAASVSTDISNLYYFTDNNAPTGLLQYRIRILKPSGAPAFTQVLKFDIGTGVALSVMPNPVTDAFDVRFGKVTSAGFNVKLIGLDGRIYINTPVTVTAGEIKHFSRPHGTAKGLYFLEIQNVTTGEKKSFKLVFQ